jgi:hypothetical protein
VDIDARASLVRAAASGDQFAVSWWDVGRGQVSLRLFSAQAGDVPTMELHPDLSRGGRPGDLALTFANGTVAAVWIPAECEDEDCVRLAKYGGDAVSVSVSAEAIRVWAAGNQDHILVGVFGSDGALEPKGPLQAIILDASTLAQERSLELDRVLGGAPSVALVPSAEGWVVGVSDHETSTGVEVVSLSFAGEVAEVRTEDSQKGTVALSWVAQPEAYLAYLHHRDRNPRTLRYRQLRGGDLAEVADNVVTESEVLDSFGLANLDGRLVVGSIPADGSSVRLTLLDQSGERSCP